MTEKKIQDGPSLRASKESSKEVEEKKQLEKNQKKDRPDPTRYGDWVKNGRCIDF